MEISLREWLIIGGILVIVLILIDGWRRIRGNRSHIRMDIDRTAIGESGDEEQRQANPELPNGGARRLAGEAYSRREPRFSAAEPRAVVLDDVVETESSSDSLSDLREAGELLPPRAAQELPADTEAVGPRPVNERAQAEEWVPERDEVSEPDATREEREALWEMDPLFDDIPVDESPRQRTTAESGESAPALRAEREDDGAEPVALGLDFDLEQPIPVLMDRVRQNQSSGRRARKREANPTAELPFEPDAAEAAPVDMAPERSDVARAAASSAERSARGRPDISVDPEEMLVIFVVAGEQPLPGAAVKRIAEACGMEFGEMQIFHRYEDPQGQGALQFSMANAVNPGTFDLATLEQSETPAVSFFMSMRDPGDPLNAYECMLATAETLARHLGAELLDGDRSVMRPQTKEHYRERIRDFEIHKRLKRTH